MRRQLLPALTMLVLLTVLTGVIYPLAVTGVAQTAIHGAANGSLVELDGVVVGSRWIGQSFTAPQYLHARPSAAGQGYDAMASSGSNDGPTSPEFLAAVRQRVAEYRAQNGLGADEAVPVDAVTASASGLDPDISVANARLQARRVAAARAIPVARVLSIVDAHTDRRDLGFLGEPRVNVLLLNLDLDALSSK